MLLDQIGVDLAHRIQCFILLARWNRVELHSICHLQKLSPHRFPIKLSGLRVRHDTKLPTFHSQGLYLLAKLRKIRFQDNIITELPILSNRKHTHIFVHIDVLHLLSLRYISTGSHTPGLSLTGLPFPETETVPCPARTPDHLLWVHNR